MEDQVILNDLMCYLGRDVESFNRTEERNFDLRLIQKVQLKYSKSEFGEASNFKEYEFIAQFAFPVDQRVMMTSSV